MAVPEPLALPLPDDGSLDALLLDIGLDPTLDPLAWLGDDNDGTLSPSNVLQPLPSSSGDAVPSSSGEDDAAARKKAEQKERIKAKNRRAQNKYREKQKQKMKDTEAAVEEASVELERLRLENERMRASKATMESVLAVREEAVGMLAATAAEQSGGAGPLPQAGSFPTCVVEEGQAGEPSNDICPLMAKHKQQLANGEGPLLGANAAAIKSMGPEDVLAQWRGIVARLIDIITTSQAEVAASSSNGGGEGNGAVADGWDERQSGAISAVLEEAVCPILQEAGMVCFEHAVFKPTNVQALLGRALDDGKSGISPQDKQKWAAVVAELQLTSQQRQRMAVYREVFLGRMGRVLDERREIFRRLGELSAPQDGLRAMRTATELWLKTHECTQELQANMAEEHRVSMELLAQVVGRTLTTRQKVVSIVKSWPFFPDVLSICTAAVEEAAAEGKGASAVPLLGS